MININEIKRHGTTILLGQGITATEGKDWNMPALKIRKDGKIIREYRGSSLYFSKKLTEEDKKYLATLAE